MQLDWSVTVPHRDLMLIFSSLSLASITIGLYPKPCMKMYSCATTSNMAYALLSCMPTRKYSPSSVNAPPSGSASSAGSYPVGPYRRTSVPRNASAAFHWPHVAGPEWPSHNQSSNSHESYAWQCTAE